MTVLIGLRIEFYDNPKDLDRRQLIGAALIEDGFTVQVVPRPGEYVSPDCFSDAGAGIGSCWPGTGPFEKVSRVEHWPARVGTNREPSVMAVIPIKAPAGHQAEELAAQFAGTGWQLSVSVQDTPFGRAATRHMKMQW